MIEGSTSTQSAYRHDIDGLRALSIAVVVAFHAGVPFASGGYVGVDVFFVISGYLITGLLLREAEKTDRISLTRFYARRIRRLLPLSATVLLTTLALGLWLVPPTARGSLVSDARSAALYVANWRFAGQATAYSDVQVEDGLLTHFWSLAIEEQFYFVWPLLILLAVSLSNRITSFSFRRSLAVVLAVVVAASFALSVIVTASSGPKAYYVTHTRLWEMGVGAGLALVAPHFTAITRDVAQTLSVVGLAAVGYGVVAFDATTAFPGSAALFPVLGTAALIATGASGQTAVAKQFSRKPFVALGRLSYAWYLWHWPAIGLALLANHRFSDGSNRNLVVAVAVVASLFVAWVSHILIENPVRHFERLQSSHRPNFVLGGVLSVLPILLGLGALATLDSGDIRIRLSNADGEVQVVAMTPAEAKDDRVFVSPHCHSDWTEVEASDDCVFGDPDGDFVVVLTGDSHARQWLPAFDRLGRSEGWAVHAWTKSACLFIDAAIYNEGLERTYDECADWRREVENSIAELDQVDLVVMTRSSGYRSRLVDQNGQVVSGALDPVLAPAAERTFSALAAHADSVVMLRDTPWPTVGSIPDCLSLSPTEPELCSFVTEDGIRDTDLARIEAPFAASAGVTVVDLTSVVCPEALCSAITKAGVIKYRDSHHLTTTFSELIAPQVGAAVVAAVSD